MVDFVGIFVVFAVFFGSGLAAPTAVPSNPQTCSLSNLHETQSIENIIFYSLTWDCHLYAWRDGFSPKLNDVGLNGTQTLMLHDPKTTADNLGSFIRSHSLTKRCRPDGNTVVFMDRQDQQIPQLVVMVRYSEKFYSLIRLNIEEMLESKPYISQSLLEQLDASENPVYTGPENPKTCIFVKKDLHCFSLSNDHVIKQSIYRLATNQGKIFYGEFSSMNHTLSKLRIIEPIMAATWDGKKNDSSVFLYDEISDGWLYKLNGGDETTADGTRKQSMHKIPTVKNMLKNLWIIDKHLLIASKCSTLQCQYFWVQIQPEAASQFTCLFTSSINVIAGVVTDVRLQPLAPNLPEQQALSAGWLLPDAKNSYWPLIILAIICFLAVVIILVGGFVYEGVGFKRRHLIEKAVDERYSNIFWKNNNNGEENRGPFSETYFQSYMETAAASSLPEERESKQQPPKTEPKLKTPVKSQMLFLDEENKTPESLKKSIPEKAGKAKPKSEKSTISTDLRTPKRPSKTPSKETKPPSQKEIKMSTHKRKKRTGKIEIPEPDNLSIEKVSNKENKDDDDIMESIKIKTNLSKFEPLANEDFAPDTLQSKKQKEKKRKSKSIENQSL